MLGSVSASNAGLRRCWWYACKEENIDPRKPSRLPLLFAIDAKLNIVGGFHYAADCKNFKYSSSGYSSGTVVYCGRDFGDGSIDGSTDGSEAAAVVVDDQVNRWHLTYAHGTL